MGKMPFCLPLVTLLGDKGITIFTSIPMLVSLSILLVSAGIHMKILYRVIHFAVMSPSSV